jgi:hypothetical protein
MLCVRQFCAGLNQIEIRLHSLIKLSDIMFRGSAFIIFRNLRASKWIWWIYFRPTFVKPQAIVFSEHSTVLYYFVSLYPSVDKTQQ